MTLPSFKENAHQIISISETKKTLSVEQFDEFYQNPSRNKKNYWSLNIKNIRLHHECPCRIGKSHPRGRNYKQGRGLLSA